MKLIGSTRKPQKKDRWKPITIRRKQEKQPRADLGPKLQVQDRVVELVQGLRHLAGLRQLPGAGVPGPCMMQGGSGSGRIGLGSAAKSFNARRYSGLRDGVFQN